LSGVTQTPDARRDYDNDDHREVVRRMHDETPSMDSSHVQALELRHAQALIELLAAKGVVPGDTVDLCCHWTQRDEHGCTHLRHATVRARHLSLVRDDPA
jgi:hypothetical protein